AELLRTPLSEMGPSARDANIEFARPRQASHGDYSCNLAMQLAKPLRQSQREIAALLVDVLSASPYLEKIEVAGAGFINLFLTTSAKQQFPRYVLESGEQFGHINLGAGKKVQVEFV